VSQNTASAVVSCHYCNVLFSGEIIFTSNMCHGSIITIQSENNYIKVTVNSNITFSNNTYKNKFITLKPVNNAANPYVYCGFQFITFKNIPNSIVLIMHYNITFVNNFYLRQFGMLPDEHCESHLHHFTTHCR